MDPFVYIKLNVCCIYAVCYWHWCWMLVMFWFDLVWFSLLALLSDMPSLHRSVYELLSVAQTGKWVSFVDNFVTIPWQQTNTLNTGWIAQPGWLADSKYAKLKLKLKWRHWHSNRMLWNIQYTGMWNVKRIRWLYYIILYCTHENHTRAYIIIFSIFINRSEWDKNGKEGEQRETFVQSLYVLHLAPYRTWHQKSLNTYLLPCI